RPHPTQHSAPPPCPGLVAARAGDRAPARRVTFPAQLIVRGSTHPRG
ncbi:transcriptional regulator, partial [Pseudomonas aeruginosa]